MSHSPESRWVFLTRAATRLSQREQHLSQTVRNLLGDWTTSTRWLDSIPLTPQGKLEQVIWE
jgi:hypothetical protein